MAEYQELDPSNSRITIQHGKKPEVKFEYPKKINPFKICFFAFLFPWIFVNLIILMVILVITSLAPSSPSNVLFNMEAIYSIYLIGLHFTLIPLVTAFIFSTNPKLLRYMPEINKKLALITSHSYSYKKIEKINSRTFEIPIFDNIFLDYKATGEFSKYLKKVEIREQDFEIVIMKAFSNKIKRKEKQDNMWYARFYFEKIPKEGCLEVWFK